MRIISVHTAFVAGRRRQQQCIAFTIGLFHLKPRVLWSTHLWVTRWTIATHFLPALRTSISVASTPVCTKCGSSSGLRRSSSWPHHADPRDTSLASSSSAGDLQDGGAGMEVSARRSATLPGRPLCAGGVYTDGRRQSRSAVSGALLVPWTRTSTGQCSFACWVWPQDLEPTTNCPSITRTVAFFIQAPAQGPPVSALLVDSAGCSCGCRVHIVRLCCDFTASLAPTTNIQTRLLQKHSTRQKPTLHRLLCVWSNMHMNVGA